MGIEGLTSTSLTGMLKAAFADLKSRWSLTNEFIGAATPAGWQDASFTIKDNHIPCFVIPGSETADKVVAYIGGFGSNPLGLIDEINMLANRGVHVVAMGLPHIGREKDFIPVFREAKKYFLSDPNSPLHAPFDTALPRKVTCHSVSAQGTLDLMSRSDFNPPENTRDFTLLNPFIDTGNSSRRFNPAVHYAYTCYARMLGSTPIGNPVDRLYMRVTGDTHSNETRILHRQIGEMLDAGERVVNSLTPDVVDAIKKRFNISIGIGRNDPMADTQTNRYVGNEILNVPVTEYDAGHYLLCKKAPPEVLFSIVDAMSGHTWPQQPAAQHASDNAHAGAFHPAAA